MKGDFSRDTFDATRHFLRVLMQQGRVQLDADWNEQVAILLNYIQNLAADIVGWYDIGEDTYISHGGPKNKCGFAITRKSDNDFFIGNGHYYVDGIFCRNNDKIPYTEQPDYPNASTIEDDKIYLVFLDVWERHITHIEDPAIHEIALGKVDTTSRAKLIWQVKTAVLSSGLNFGDMNPSWKNFLDTWQPINRGRLKAQGKQASKQKDPCLISPDASYRGAENQLYRVEFHSKGLAWDGTEPGKSAAATFKWSRDNGAVVYPIQEIKIVSDGTTTTTVVTLEQLWNDDRFALIEGDWVEIMDDDYVLQVGIETSRSVEPLLKVLKIDIINRQITLEGKTDSTVGQETAKHPLLRRWDHKGNGIGNGNAYLADNGALFVKEKEWISLENGIQIWFDEASEGLPHEYRRDDFWLIPARIATGDIEWPKDNNNGVPKAIAPHGVEHHFAPLAIIIPSQPIVNCRRQFNLTSIFPTGGTVQILGVAPDEKKSDQINSSKISTSKRSKTNKAKPS